MSLFGPSDPGLVRSIMDGLREPIWSVEVTPRIVRDEDVRALALQHEEHRAVTEDGGLPSVELTPPKPPRPPV